MVPVGAAVRNAEEQGEFQRERTLRGLLHRPAQGDSSHGGLRLQDRARAGWQVRRLRLPDWRVERNSPPADGQGEYAVTPSNASTLSWKFTCNRAARNLVAYSSRSRCSHGVESVLCSFVSITDQVCRVYVYS